MVAQQDRARRIPQLLALAGARAGVEADQLGVRREARLGLSRPETEGAAEVLAGQLVQRRVVEVAEPLAVDVDRLGDDRRLDVSVR